jgi:hypothetical protein
VKKVIRFYTHKIIKYSCIPIFMYYSYDPMLEIPLEIDSTDSRIMFLKSISQTVAIKTKIKLNNRKLYSADGYCVQELLKLVNLLYSCEQLAHKQVKLAFSQGVIMEEGGGVKVQSSTSFNTSKFHEKLSMIPV